jgi:hypothetical protein
VVDPDTGYTLYQQTTASLGTMYISTDGTDQRGQLAPELTRPGAKIYSAISFGNRIIATTLNSLIVYEGGVLKFRFDGIGYLGTMLVRYINGVIYVTGRELFVSRDQGQSFTQVLTAPYRPGDVWSTGGVVYTASNMGGLLYMSTDNGATFRPWLGGATKVAR